MAEDKKNKKTKRPTAQKRDIRNEKRRVVNKCFKSRVRTAQRRFLDAVSTGKEASVVKELLSDVYSLMDKGVKRGLYKRNKADRTKARCTARAKAALA